MSEFFKGRKTHLLQEWIDELPEDSFLYIAIDPLGDGNWEDHKINVANVAGDGGGVETVTGNIVDNTDPLNPIVTQVQSDWDEVNTLLPSFILNKPTITGVTPGGLDTQVQYNNAGAFGGIAGATSNGTLIFIPVLYGGFASSGTLTLGSTSNATKGKILFGTSAYDEVNNRLGLGTTSPTHALTLDQGSAAAFYNTVDQVTNVEKLEMYWSGNMFYIDSAFTSGTGVQRDMTIRTTTGTACSLYLKSGAVVMGNPGGVIISTCGHAFDSDILLKGTFFFDNSSIGKITYNRVTIATLGTNKITIEGQGGTSSGAIPDVNGGTVEIKSGLSKGTGTSHIDFYTASAGVTTVDNTPTLKMTLQGDGGLTINNRSAVPPTPTAASTLYTDSGELKVIDSSGNTTTLSPHNFSLIPEGPSDEMAWSHYSEKDGKKINVDMYRLAQLVEKLTGEKLIWKQDLQ